MMSVEIICDGAEAVRNHTRQYKHREEKKTHDTLVMAAYEWGLMKGEGHGLSGQATAFQMCKECNETLLLEIMKIVNGDFTTNGRYAVRIEKLENKGARG